jgi:hypothetical protein
MDLTPTDPTVLWRLTRGAATAHATLIPGAEQATLTWYFDGVMDRAEQYGTLEIALARADHVRSILLQDGWSEG